MLKELLDAQIRARGLSIRQAAQEIGVAHTTLMGALKGDPLEVETLYKFCDWLHVKPSLIIADDHGDDPSGAFSVIADVVPGLVEILKDATNDFKAGLLTEDDLEEITSYIAFRLKARKEKDARAKRDVSG